MDVLQVLQEPTVILRSGASSKKQVLKALSEVLAESSGVDERDVFLSLMEREKLGSTGLGGGIAIPHCKFSDLDRFHAVILTTAEPVDFDAADDAPVDVFVCLMAQEAASADHLKVLSKISRLLRDEANVQKLRIAENEKQILSVLGGTGDQPSAA